ncbi:MAG: hypothetical protein QME12_06360 [Nanoarchaeota archaeon]|nr:hypothetical protein [Nanoarchaeota archaeon]
MDEIDSLISDLTAFDDEKYYNMDFDDVAKLAEPIMDRLVEIGREHIDKIGSLLNKEETWSCYFAIKILRGLKDRQALPYLIDFLKKDNEDSVDYYENYEGAMYAVQELGKDALPALLAAVKEAIAMEEDKTYLFGALFDAKSEEAYNLLAEIADDFLKNSDKYDVWLDAELFFSSFREQERKEAIPVLEKIKARLDRYVEIDDAIEYLTDNEAYEISSEKSIQRLENEYKEYKEKTDAILEKDRQELKFPEALDMDESSVDFDDGGNAIKATFVFKTRVLQGIEFASLFRGEKERVVIDNSNTEQYAPLLMAIEHAIYDYCQQDSSIKDMNIINSLKAVRDNLCEKFEEGSLEQWIILGLKSFLLSSDYSQAEVLACVSKVLNSAKLHRAESGSRGYLQFMSEFFEHPEDFGDDEDGKQYEAR